MPTLAANGVSLYYELDGPEDGDVLVLSNGILMSTGTWGYQVAALSRNYRLLRYDCRGMWQSEHPAGPYSFEQHADDLAALLDGLHIQRAHIAGISYGAEVSMFFALRYPQRTRSLILSSAVSEIDPVLRGVAETWLQAARRRDADLLFATTYPFNFSGRWITANSAALEAAQTRYGSLDFDAFAELCLAFLNLDVTERLAKITAPVLVMVGEDDILKPRSYSDRMVKAMPQAVYALVPGAGHALCLEAPAAFNSLVLGFLAQLSSTLQ